MLFNSYVFIFAFLPITLLGFFLLGGRGASRLAIGWVTVCSLFFYGWWNPKYLVLIAVLILFNFWMGVLLGHAPKTPRARLLLIFGLAVNLGVLGYYKYTNFLVDSFNSAFGSHVEMAQIVLPLGISFFTFQKIGYLVDAYQGKTKEYNFVDFCLFVCFFPQLIAGPIVHHKEIIPQFEQKKVFKFNAEDFSIGLTIFIFGLYKKVVFADTVAAFASRSFAAAAQGEALGFYQAWGGALAYTVQIYFDFSGYSDMAIGLARMFGILLPLNFNSPYKAVNIIDFWRRWHITLSTFLRDYLYISLGGNRVGEVRRYLNIFVTMLLGGIWHGAGWTFVIWGALHGLYITINHAWQDLRKSRGADLSQTTWLGTNVSRVATFLFVVIGWVFFRAENFPAAIAMLKGMTHFGQAVRINLGDVKATIRPLVWIGGLLAIAWFLPNTQEIMARVRPALGILPPAPRRFVWEPTPRWALYTSIAFLIALLHLSQITEFLYFQF
jgi:alginate O-acetyltransferase complex protein AlgI